MSERGSAPSLGSTCRWAGGRAAGWPGGIQQLCSGAAPHAGLSSPAQNAERSTAPLLPFAPASAPVPLPPAGRCTRPTAGARRCAARWTTCPQRWWRAATTTPMWTSGAWCVLPCCHKPAAAAHVHRPPAAKVPGAGLVRGDGLLGVGAGQHQAAPADEQLGPPPRLASPRLASPPSSTPPCLLTFALHPPPLPLPAPPPNYAASRPALPCPAGRAVLRVPVRPAAL